jgi:hypothetical protein
MRGDLSETPVAAACRELARSGSTGALVLEGPGGRARIYLVEGRLVAAFSPTPRARLGDRLVGAGLLDRDELRAALEQQHGDPGVGPLGALLVSRGSVRRAAIRVFAHEQLLDALFEICGWRYGTFEFVPGDAPTNSQVPVDLAVAYALDEVARRGREWEELSQLIPTLEAVPQLRTGGASATTPLEPDGFSVLASVDGERSIRELAADLGYGEIETGRIVHRLVLLDLVEITLPEDEVGAALDEAFAFLSGPTDDEPDLAVDDPSPEIGATADAGSEERAHPDVGEPAADEPGRDEPAAGEPGPDEPAAGEPGPDEPAAGEPAAGGPHAVEVAQDLEIAADDDPLEVEVAADDDPLEVDADTAADAGARDADRSGVEQDASAPAAFGDAPERPAGTDDAPVTSAEVSEFLRELSQLALDPPPARPGPRTRSEDPGSARGPASDDAKRRKRGLFGWGG